MWAFHFHGWGYHTGLGWIQHHRQNGKLRWRSQRIDGTFLWHRTKFFGCKIVRKEFRTVMTSNSIVRAHSFFRLIMDFNQMSKYSLFAFFAWNMLSLSSAIIALQFQLVKYISFCSLRSAWLTNENSSFIFSIFKVGWWLKYIGNGSFVLRVDLDGHISFHDLWTRHTGDQSIWGIRRWTWPMRLVFVVDWNAANVCDFSIGHSISNWAVKLCKHHVRARNTEKGGSLHVTFEFACFNLPISISRLSTKRSHFLWHFENSNKTVLEPIWKKCCGIWMHSQLV